MNPGLTLQANDGVVEAQVDSWQSFGDALRGDFDPSLYVWRGQADVNWPLQPRLVRRFLKEQILGLDDQLRVAVQHLSEFKMAIRGRRGPNAQALPEIKSATSAEAMDLWALGQHHHLDTPLLDWTKSAYAALFFAFEQPSEEVAWLNEEVRGQPEAAETTRERGIFALHTGILTGGIGKSDLKFVEPPGDEHVRLVSQSALFTSAIYEMHLEQWVRENFAGPAEKRGRAFGAMLKFRIKDFGRTRCLAELNQMNINHKSLFPDLEGASRYCNLMRTL